MSWLMLRLDIVGLIMIPSPTILQELTFTYSRSARSLFDLKPVIYDTDWFSGEEAAGNRDIYFMYREGYRSKADHDVMKAHRIRFDITQIPPGRLGAEYVKTMGHYHPKTSETPGSLSYPEVYQVIAGRATYLMQKQDMSAFFVIDAKAGDVVLIPPGFGHVTINASDEELLMSNWVSDTFRSDYGTILENHGFAYYLTEEGFVPNAFYARPRMPFPEISFMKPSDHPEFGLFCGTDMYDLIRTPEMLSFLQFPENFFRTPAGQRSF